MEATTYALVWKTATHPIMKYKLPLIVVVIKNNTLGQLKWEQLVFPILSSTSATSSSCVSGAATPAPTPVQIVSGSVGASDATITVHDSDSQAVTLGLDEAGAPTDWCAADPARRARGRQRKATARIKGSAFSRPGPSCLSARCALPSVVDPPPQNGPRQPDTT
jgi:hypothetical protein